MLNTNDWVVAISPASGDIKVRRSEDASALLLEPDCFFRLITADWATAFERMGIASELVVRVYDHAEGVELAHAGKGGAKPGAGPGQLRIAYVSVASRDELSQLISVVSVFNQLGTQVLYIICPTEFHGVLRQMTNDNITLISQVHANSIFVHLVITYGSAVLHFLKLQIPVIVMGPKGLGGLVTAESFDCLYRRHFMGRPGAMAGEPVPMEILGEEMLSIRHDQRELAELQRLAENTRVQSLAEADSIVEGIALHFHHIFDIRRRGDLKPRILSNIYFKKIQARALVIRSQLHDVLAQVDKQDLQFLKKMDGTISCTDLLAQSGMAEDEFWQTLYSLMYKKIICF
jgi:hypothetical protein